MVNPKQAKVYTEVLDILNHLNLEDYYKIPIRLKKFLKRNADKNYEPNFNYKKGIENANLSDESRALLSAICIKYIANSEEKLQIMECLKKNG